MNVSLDQKIDKGEERNVVPQWRDTETWVNGIVGRVPWLRRARLHRFGRIVRPVKDLLVRGWRVGPEKQWKEEDCNTFRHSLTPPTVWVGMGSTRRKRCISHQDIGKWELLLDPLAEGTDRHMVCRIGEGGGSSTLSNLVVSSISTWMLSVAAISSKGKE